jgi:hypothetical protein
VACGASSTEDSREGAFSKKTSASTALKATASHRKIFVLFCMSAAIPGNFRWCHPPVRAFNFEKVYRGIIGERLE